MEEITRSGGIPKEANQIHSSEKQLSGEQTLLDPSKLSLENMFC